jgi:hypothetical protein
MFHKKWNCSALCWSSWIPQKDAIPNPDVMQQQTYWRPGEWLYKSKFWLESRKMVEKIIVLAGEH